MEFTALFLAVSIAMLAAWWGTRALALALFAVTLVACVATYLHHASDVLKLSRTLWRLSLPKTRSI